ncbi:MAG: ATP synthase F0 subunit B [Clostridiales bacterium]|nr:ATP synthase F0 subunit B [Clostridiales bacterium]
MNFEIALLSALVPEGRVFGLDLQTLISIGIMLFNVLVLSAVLGFILYEPVKEFMAKRSDRISGQLDDAREKMAEAESLKAEYEKRLAEIDVERIKILESARKTASERSRNIVDEARHEAATIRRHTQEGVIAERERLKEETRLYIIELSSLMAGKFVEHSIDAETQDRLFDETMAQLEEARWLS